MRDIKGLFVSLRVVIKIVTNSIKPKKRYSILATTRFSPKTLNSGARAQIAPGVVK